MLFNKKVKSFTLVEMLVVLVLSGIVISILYVAYYNISGYQLTLERKQQQLRDLSGLYFQMRRDVDRSTEVWADAKYAITCRNSQRGIDVNYLFTPDAVVRTQREVVDTFHCRSGDPQFLFDNVTVNEFPSKIDVLSFTLSLHDSVQFSVLKHYDAASLIETKRDTLP